MNRGIVWITQFKKDYKMAVKRHLNIELLDDIIRALSRGETLPEKNKDHALLGDWIGHRECHIQPDWLLVPLKIYTDNSKTLALTTAGVFYCDFIYNYSCVLYPRSSLVNIKKANKKKVLTSIESVTTNHH